MSRTLNNVRMGRNLGIWIANECINGDKMSKLRKGRTLRKLEKKERKLQKKIYMIKTYGVARYYLAFWFGQWVLFTGNKKKQNTNAQVVDEQNEKPYFKFYRDEKIANGYAKRLIGKYNQINVIPVFDGSNNPVGYVLNAKEKIG